MTFTQDDWARQRKSTGRLNHDQMDGKVKALARQLQAEQLKKTDHWKSLKRARRREAEYKNLLDFISNNVIPGLPRLLSNSKKEGWGPLKTTEKAVLASKGEYHPRNYTEFDKDLAILMYELGGGAASHALNKAPTMLPSRHTIADVRRQLSLRITVGDAKVSDILENIEVLFKDAEVGNQGRVGITLSQDEIAGDGRLCYLDDTDEIGGLCEHANSHLETFKMGSDLKATEAVVNAIRAGDIHVGKEFSVAAFSRHAEIDYGAKPVLIMPTCKKGSWQSSAELLQKLIQAWKLSPYGEAKHGPLQAIASDGDGRRRAALYLICMHRRLGPGDPIYQFLSELERQGLNLCVICVGLCTLLCSKEGMLVNGVVVNKALLAHWLEKLSGHDWSDESIHALLNPKDPQDVPRAVKLLCLIADLQHLDTSGFTPSEKKTHRAISLLGEMFDALVEPFINPILSLSEQITALAKFAHIACALFLKHEGDFLSNQLYGDLQCMVKNAVFKIAHTKALNPQLKVFLCLLGDDVLETLFGRSRMIGGHSPNMAVDELRQRFCSALRMDEIFRKYPYLEQKARRLKLVRSRDVDHLSPDQWEGDITADKCDIAGCWVKAIAEARIVLMKYDCDVDFAALFSQEGFDLMRPKGGEHYPGVSAEVDRSMADYTNDSPIDDSSDTIHILRFNAQAALDAEKEAAETDVEPHSMWIKLGDDDRKVAHKKAILPSTIYSKSLADNHLLKIQGLFATLIAFNTSKVSLAILQCTGIKIVNTSPVTYLDAAPIAEISLPKTRYEITGQIMSLVPFMDAGGEISWAWPADFVAFDSVKAKKATSTDAAARMRHLSTSVDGRLVLPLISADVKQVALEEILNLQPRADSNSEKTWVFSTAQLDVMGSTLLSRVQDDEVRLKIPVNGPVKQGRYPYEAVVTDGRFTSISYCFSSVAAPAAKDSRRPCRICNDDIAGPDRQNHMGKHILLALRGVGEARVLKQVAKKYPCGFCGQAISDGTCTIGVKSGKAVSSCPEAYQFQVSAASKSSATKPCTNVPIRCSLCTEYYWKYSMAPHLEERHPTWEVTMPEKSRQDLISKITITHDEEHRLGARVAEVEAGAESVSAGRKRGPPTSLPGTPRRSRVLVTAPHRVTTVARAQDVPISSPADVFT
ncbi:hypothetical protein GGX14DRAFT_511117 [Mycena pura]|uniref:Uncharacterized protein n=1 Tax=Mycena pura TaxID=153505 RepID=A0AAD6YSR2_9AGAR|nr:hypothetical protein GGX14DRAFT_511117 [Mycena pura]